MGEGVWGDGGKEEWMGGLWFRSDQTGRHVGMRWHVAMGCHVGMGLDGDRFIHPHGVQLHSRTTCARWSSNALNSSILRLWSVSHRAASFAYSSTFARHTGRVAEAASAFAAATATACAAAASAAACDAAIAATADASASSGADETTAAAALSAAVAAAVAADADASAAAVSATFLAAIARSDGCAAASASSNHLESPVGRKCTKRLTK